MQLIDEVKEQCRFVAQGIVDESERAYHRIYINPVVDGGRKMKRIIAAAICAIAVGAAFGARLEGTVTRVYDGDTIWVDNRYGRHTVRLAKIDAPELDQAFGEEAREHLSSLINGMIVSVEYSSSDRNNRILGIVYFGNLEVNLRMVWDGYAWHYKQYDNSKSYADAEFDACASRRGLWSDPNPIPPWEFRKMQCERLRQVQREQPRQVQLPPGVIGYVGGEPIFAKSTYGGFVQTSELEKRYKRARAIEKEEITRVWNDFLASSAGRSFFLRKQCDRQMNRIKAQQLNAIGKKMMLIASLERKIVWCKSDKEKSKLERELEIQKKELDFLNSQCKNDPLDRCSNYEKAMRYETGDGVEKNIEEAVYWYRRTVDESRENYAAIEALRRLGKWDLRISW